MTSAAGSARSTRRNYDLILGYALRRTQHADALDVVSETFLVAWRRLPHVPDADEARLWLYGTARRVLANHERTQRRRARLNVRLADEAATAPDVVPERTGGVVASAFRRLRPEDRELLALVAWEGLGAHEIARVIGCSRNAARIRVHSARRRLAHELDQEDGSVKHERSSGHASLTAIGSSSQSRPLRRSPPSAGFCSAGRTGRRRLRPRPH
jgi:RNA polymerase sigma factor (sigma-70 family)